MIAGIRSWEAGGLVERRGCATSYVWIGGGGTFLKPREINQARAACRRGGPSFEVNHFCAGC